MKFYHYKKRGVGNSFSHGEGGGGGHNMLWGNINTGVGSFSHTEGGRKTFPLFKGRGSQNKSSFLGAQKVSDPRFSHFVAPSP